MIVLRFLRYQRFFFKFKKRDFLRSLDVARIISNSDCYELSRPGGIHEVQ